MSAHLFPIVLAGGSGTRFWPLSRERRPKQLLPLAGPQPLIVDTLQRLKGLCPPGNISVVCGAAHAASIRRLTRLRPAQVWVEPAARNTAPCIGWAALKVLRRDPEGVLAVFPSDHHVASPARFREVIRRCERIAADGTLCTVGLKPTRPETGYGYLRLGASLGGGAHRVDAFIEKPSAEKAERLARRGHLWNGGIFVFRADAILAEIERQLPSLRRVLHRIAPGVGTPAERRLLARWFPKAPKVSIDVGVMEGARRIATVSGDFGWSDLGSFASLPEVRRADARGNVAEGSAILVDSDDCIVLARGRPVAVVGLRGMVVVDAGDSLLVVPRDRCQDVRAVVEALKTRHRHLV
jgi:mannose-1-phosphate guanylyltransferase